MDIAAECKSSAQQWYQRKLEFNAPLSWRSDVKINTEDIFRNFSVIFKKKEEPIQLEDLFSPSKFTRGKIPLRILIEGDPGFGKTEICEKITYDWAKNVEYMTHYSLLLYLETKEIAGKTLQQVITESKTIFPEDFEIKREEIWDFVNKNQKEIIFIIDAYDDISNMSRNDDEIFKVFSGHKLRDATVIVTCRTNICPDLQSLADKHVRIRPFQPKDIEKVIRNYFIDETDADELLQRINFDDERVIDLLSIPLNVHLICVLWEDSRQEDDAKFPKTVTDIFTVLCKLNIRKYCDKINVKMGKDIPAACQEILEGLCELANNTVKSSNLKSHIEEDQLAAQFKEEEERKQVIKMGFLSKKYRILHGAAVAYYDFIGSVWRDYLAAFHFYNQVKTSSMSIDEVESELTKCQSNPMVRMFLDGLMDETITMSSEAEISVFSNIYHWLGKM